MDILHVLQNQLSSGVMSAVRLEPGSMIEGRVTELYPGNMAKLIVNGKNLTAELKTGVEKNRHYWFRVEPSDTVPLLKIVREAGSLSQPEKLLPYLKTEVSKPNTETVRMLQREGMPLLGSQIEAVTKIRIRDNIPPAKMMEALALLHSRGMPVRGETIQAALALSETDKLGSLLKSSLEAVPPGSERKFPFLKNAGDRTIVPQLPMIERLINESLIQSGRNRETILHVLFGNQRPEASAWPAVLKQILQASAQFKGSEHATGAMQVKLTESSLPHFLARREIPQLRGDVQSAALLQSSFTRNLLLDHALLFPKALPGSGELPGGSSELGKIKSELELLKGMAPKAGNTADAAVRIISGLQLVSSDQPQAPGIWSMIPFPLDQTGIHIQWSGKKNG
ncbi:hypothetical protein [Alkalicoccus luteus]|uniref:Uncharacterized protein n=1 Tax=Alkalicoccus luteus TaxID=1237094 RepID=A0A969PLG0_9BACI|nr:hypothetical protein [Alkalicoccus luteus]NJP36371.1 hypothetical protein [Alkalicoccus luteus]